MRAETAAALKRINRHFYSRHAAEFSARREAPWPGWRRVAEGVERRRQDRAGVISVLDLGCGNGRLARFLDARWPDGFEYLGVSAISCRGMPMSHGTVKCEHGVLPVPAPAVLRLMSGVPTYPLDIDGETVTPTAAALLRELVTDWRDAPAMTISQQGYGAGTKDFPRANVLRLIVGTVAPDATRAETLELLSTNLDDMNPEWLPPLLDRLLTAGALDAWLTPILMKKGRPAQMLSVLCGAATVETLRTLMFQHTSTLGIRRETVERTSLERKISRVDTEWGPVSVKVARLPHGEERAAPEHADCRRISEAHDVPLARVYDAAMDAWRRGKFTSVR